VTGDRHDLVGAYATDALDPAERAEAEHHLAFCADCRDELSAYREVLAALSTRAVAPPAALEDAVVAAATGRRSREAEPTSPEREPPARPGWRAMLAAAAAAAAIFVVGGAVGRVTAPEAPAASGQTSIDSVLAVAAADDAAFVPADVMGTPARLVVSDEMGKAAFLASDLPTPAKGECYQVWRVAPDGTKTSAGVFTPDADGRVAVVLEGSAAGDSFVITTEPPGGSAKPTGDMVGQIDS
jgi:anti-sigma-K factor RskA